MTTTVPVDNGTNITVTTSLDPSTGTYTTTASYPALGVTFTGTPQQVTNQLNELVNNGTVTDPTVANGIDSATNTIFDQQHYVGQFVNTPNVNPATPIPATTATTTTNTNTTTTTVTHTGGGSVTTTVNPDGTITKTVVPDQNSTVTTTTTESANPDLPPQPVPAVNTPTQQVTPGIQTTQTNTQPLTGSADEDSNAQNDPSSNQQSAVMVNNTGNAPTASPSNATSAASPSAAPQGVSTTGGPGKRIQNPLSNLASYTYIISLYTMTPAAHDAWVASGKKDIGTLIGEAGSGVFLLCQSGGIDNTSTQRAQGFELDYYIDNLKCESSITAKASGGDFFTLNFSFDIIEPYGFSFLKNLRAAQTQLYGANQTTATGSPNSNKSGPQENPLRGVYTLGIKFVGWNIDGTPVKGTDTFLGGQLDATSTSDSVFQQYYDIQITEFTFKLDGKPVVYHITATHLDTGAGLGAKRGTIDNQISVEGGSVDNILQGIIGQLNDAEQDRLKNKKVQYANNYYLTYNGPEADLIKRATIVSPADLDKYKWTGPKTEKPADNNEATAQKTPPNNTARTMSIGAGTSVNAAISQVIGQSSYLLDALNAVYTTNLTPTEQGTPPVKPNPDPKKVAWYNLSVEVKNMKWDTLRGDWVYDITYVISTYDTPAIQTPYASDGGEYPGPYKRYDYWFTGENKEVVGLEFNYNAAYFLGAVDSSNDPNNTPSENKGAPVAPGKPAGTGNQGKTTMPANAGADSYKSYLYDPAAYQDIHMKVLGDPDWLVSIDPPPQGNGPGNAAEVYNKYYGPNGASVNPNNSMCFVEVNFLEAVDYDTHNKGVLVLNDQLYFGLGSPASGPPPKGIVFLVISIESTFSNGKFTQDIHMQGTVWPNADTSTPSTDRPGTKPSNSASQAGDARTASGAGNNNSGPLPGDSGATAGATGLRGSALSPEEAANAAAWQAATRAEYLASLKPTTPNSNTASTPKTTNTGAQGKPVQDDDAGSQPTTSAGQPSVPQYINSRG